MRDRLRIVWPRKRDSVSWKRVVGWFAVTILGLILLALAGGAMLLRSARFHSFLLTKIARSASDSLGAQVTIRDFSFDLHNLALDAHGVIVQSTGKHNEKPLMSVDALRVDMTVISLLRREWYLNDVEIRNPVVHLYIDKSGESNLPTPQPSNTNVFDLAIRHVLITDGEIYYNDQKSPLNADLRDLKFVSAYDVAQGGRYSGEIGYRQGSVRYGNYEPLPHNLQAKFDATRAGTNLSRVTVSLGSSELRLDASVTNYESPRVEATYDARIDTGEFRHILNNSSLPAGMLHLAGRMRYQDVPGGTQPLLDAVQLEGTVTSASLALRTPEMRGEVRNVQAHYKIADGNAVLDPFTASLLSGSITANATIRDLMATRKTGLHATLRGVSLAAAKAMFSDNLSLQDVKLDGTTDIDADATWSGSMKDLVVRANATVASTIAPEKAVNPVSVPLDGSIHAEYWGRNKVLTLTRSNLHSPTTSIDLDGTISENSAMQVRVQTTDLHEWETIAASFQQASGAGQPVKPLGLAGTATFVGTLRGSTRNPTVAGLLTAANLRVRGGGWRSLQTGVLLSPSQAALQNGTLIPAGPGKAVFNVTTALSDWSYHPDNPITIGLKISSLPISDLARLASVQSPVSGILTADIAVRGTQKNPIGQGRVNLVNATFSGETIPSAQLDFQGNGDVVHGNLNLQTETGRAVGTIAYYPKNEGYNASLEASGIRLEGFQTVKANKAAVAGVFSLSASGQGTITNPQLQATVKVPELKLGQQAIRGVVLQTTVQNHLANIALNSEAVGTYIRVSGKIVLSGDYNVEATADTGSIPIEPLLATYMPESSNLISGMTELHAAIRGPLKSRANLEGHLEVKTLNLSYNNEIQVAAATPIRADYRNGTLTLQPGVLQGTGTDLHFEGNVPILSSAPTTLALNGTVDLRLAKIFLPDLEASGQARFDINSTGTLTNPNIKGQIHVQDVNLKQRGDPIGLQGANGVLTVSNNRVDIASLKGLIGGGTVSASGGLAYRPVVQFDLGLKGQGIDYVYEGQIRSRTDVDLALVGNKHGGTLTGRVQIDRLSFTPDFDLATFINTSGATSPPPVTGGYADNLKLNVAVQTAPNINLVSRNISVKGGANLRVQGTVSQPVIVGRTNLTGGDVIFMGNRYLIKDGTIDFVNPNRTEPVVNISVATTIDQYNIQMRIHGPSDRLNTTYTSDPALPPVDIINLLAFGKTTEATAASQATPGRLGAESVLASSLSSQVVGQVARLAGISHISIDPLLGGNGQNISARLAVQQRVTSNLYVTFATDVAATQRPEVQVQYQFNQRWSVTADRNQNGGFSFDARLHKTF